MADTTKPYHWGRPNPNYAGPSRAAASDPAQAADPGSDFPASAAAPTRLDGLDGLSRLTGVDFAGIPPERLYDNCDVSIQVVDSPHGEDVCPMEFDFESSYYHGGDPFDQRDEFAYYFECTGDTGRDEDQYRAAWSEFEQWVDRLDDEHGGQYGVPVPQSDLIVRVDRNWLESRNPG